jgi:hypothetical protein
MGNDISMMVGEIITNFELYVWIAFGLFVVGILAVLVYDNGTADSKLNRRKQQHQSETSSQSD